MQLQEAEMPTVQ